MIANKVFDVSTKNIEGQLTQTLYMDCSNTLCPPNTEQNLRKNLWHLYFHYFRIGSINKYLADPEYITKEYIDNLVKDYAKTSINIKKIDADYIYYGPWEKQFSKANFNNNQSELIYKNPEVNIYRIIK